jgi:thiol:disulfide interchange protein
MNSSSRLEPSHLDKWGIAISSICLVHCLALPIIIALLPALTSIIPSDGWVHGILIGFAFPVTGLALWRGYRQHQDIHLLIMGGLGLTCIALALVYTDNRTADVSMTLFGGLLIVVAHTLNLRAHRHPNDFPHEDQTTFSVPDNTPPSGHHHLL